MSKLTWNRKHFIDIDSLTEEDIREIVEQADTFLEVLKRPVKKVPVLKGKTIVTLFYENSTRTRCSFELAAKNLSADTIDISVATSAVKKGETLVDTADNLIAMGVDAVIIRHGASGICHQLTRAVGNKATIINAGDGWHGHPSQAMLDYYTMRKHIGSVEGKKISIIGDIIHSRVARSNIELLNKLGADVHICGPSTLIPLEIEKMGVTTHYALEEAISEADVIMMLRMQLERHDSGIIPSLGEYTNLYCLTKEKLEKFANPDVYIMHPGPMNRAVEIASDVADDPNRSLILDQVNNGLAIRMSILYLTLTGGGLQANVA